MVNAETGRIVDLLESRESADVAAWFATFPNIEVVSRDGSMLYAKAIRTAHPNALQVSDRFHLLKGLTDAARQFVSSTVEQRIAIPSDTVPSNYWQKQSCSEPDLPQKLHNDTTKKRMGDMEKVRHLALRGACFMRFFCRPDLLLKGLQVALRVICHFACVQMGGISSLAVPLHMRNAHGAVREIVLACRLPVQV
jgi:Transposase and inactivated derivatives